MANRIFRTAARLSGLAVICGMLGTLPATMPTMASDNPAAAGTAVQTSAPVASARTAAKTAPVATAPVAEPAKPKIAARRPADRARARAILPRRYVRYAAYQPAPAIRAGAWYARHFVLMLGIGY